MIGEGWTEQVRRRLEALLADPRLPSSSVAFDADGTLWRGDIGEEVLRRLVAEARAPRDAVDRYLALTDEDMVGACAYCLHAMAGLPLLELERATNAVLDAGSHGSLIAPTVALAAELGRRGAEVWIVSGSNVWSVRAAADRAGLTGARVLGVGGDVLGGKITGDVDAPIPCRAGKVAALLEVRAKAPLLFAAGNSDYDLDLLRYAELPLAVGPKDRGSVLLTEAERRRWLTLRV